MIISQLTGGMGNQMFQYSCGFAVAQRLKVPHKYYFESFEGNTPRSFELGCFTISSEKATTAEITKVRDVTPFTLLRNSTHIYKEPHFEYDKNIMTVSDQTELQGYWQSDKYFSPYENELKKQFLFSKPLTRRNKELLEKYAKNTLVSLHVRRGDYVSNAAAHQFHGLTTLDFYKTAVSVLLKKFKNVVFLIFSDDPQWVQDNLQDTGKCIFVTWNQGAQSYNDLHLMSKCHHHILANSSFSWWGAWLSNHSPHIVIAPKKWFNDFTINTSDLLPSSWIRL